MSLANSADNMAVRVGDYLLSHPDFLNDNPHILEQLSLSHSAGKNIASLIELQVQRLRESRRYQQQQIDCLHTASESDQDMTVAAQAAALKMMVITDTDALYEQLFNTLRQLFRARYLRIFLFTNSDVALKQPDIHVDRRDCRIQRMFIELFNRKKSLCDSLQQEYVTMLFGAGEPVRSTALIPHVENDDWYLFAVGSDEMNCYRQGFELRLMEFLVAVFRLRLPAAINNGDG